MVAETPDQIEGDNYDVPFSVRVHLDARAAQAKASAFGEGYTPKVRKPYTITKQREKWTEEEHQRFLEALKLYGRSWRQIEEHIGTKTAIQIRSHAQKFFAKVARDSNSDCEGSINPIGIPPPRPKKKPLHPYPRKVLDSYKMTVADPNQPELSPPSKLCEERDNRSPTSVLSAIGSETCGSPLSGLQRSRHSPMSCTTDDANSANHLLNENDNECMASNSCVEEEKGSLQPVQMSACANSCDRSTKELDFLTLGGACSMEDPFTQKTSTTIKLFGRTVLLNENHKLSFSGVENNDISTSDATLEKLDFRNSQNAGNIIDPQFGSAFAPLPVLVPEYPANEDCCQVGVFSTSIPCLAWYQSLVLPQVSFGNQTAVETVVDSSYKGMQVNDKQTEGSWTGSSSGSVSEVNSGRQKSDAIESKTVAKLAKQGSAKGFVPYKRCLAERDATSPIVAAEGREGQRARVCL